MSRLEDRLRDALHAGTDDVEPAPDLFAACSAAWRRTAGAGGSALAWRSAPPLPSLRSRRSSFSRPTTKMESCTWTGGSSRCS